MSITPYIAQSISFASQLFPGYIAYYLYNQFVTPQVDLPVLLLDNECPALPNTTIIHPGPLLSLDYLQSLPVLQATTQEELQRIQQLTGYRSRILSLAGMIKGGDWTPVLQDLALKEEGHLWVLAAYAEGRLDPQEVATAFIFLNGVHASVDGEWQIVPSDLYAEADIPPHLRFALVYPHPRYIPHFADVEPIPSYPILLEKVGCGPTVPVYGAPDQEVLLSFWDQGIVPFALLPPGSRRTNGDDLVEAILNDLYIGCVERSTLAPYYRDFARVLIACRKGMPPIQAELDQTYTLPEIHLDGASMQDQASYLMLYALMRIFKANESQHITAAPTLESMRSFLIEQADFVLHGRFCRPLSEGVIEECMKFVAGEMKLQE